MSNVPLPPRHIDAYIEGERGTFPLYKDGYTADQLHAHAAAVSAADNAALKTMLADARAADIHSCHDDCTRDGCVNGRLRERIEALERLVIDAAYALDKARIWSGMGWTYNPLHPVHYTLMRERLHNECANIEAARAAMRASADTQEIER